MSASAYISHRVERDVLVARFEVEKVGEREARIIEAEVAELASRNSWRVVADLGSVMLLASAGLGLLVTLSKRCAQGAGKLVVCGVSEDIMGVMKVTNLHRLLTLAPDVGAALKAVR